MKTMTKFLLIALIVGFALPTIAQTSYRNTFSGKTFAKATSRTDTSTIVTVGGIPNISIQTTSTGTDSAAITVTIDALINGVWSNTVTSQALQLGRPAAHTLATTKGQVSDFTLRDNGRIADLLQNASQLRIRNVITAGANDSTSALTYTQNVVLRKVAR